MRLRLIPLVLLCACVPSGARQRVSGYCQRGGQTIVVNAIASSAATPVQRSYPQCTVNVYVSGGASGTVSTNGVNVTWLSGNVQFNSNWNSRQIVINAVAYTILNVTSATTLTLTAGAGVQTDVAWSMSTAPAALYDSVGAASANPFTASSTGYWYFYSDDGAYDVQFSGIGLGAPFTLGATPAADPFFLGSGAGAVPWLRSSKLAALPVNPQDYGARANGVDNDAPAIQLAINATPAGGVLYVPPGSYRLAGNGDQLLLINKPMTFKCAGWGLTLLNIDAAVPNTTDILRVFGGNNVGAKIEDCQFNVPADGVARHAIHLDATHAGGGGVISNFELTHNFIGVKHVAGKAIQMTLAAPDTDGVFDGVISRNAVYGGIGGSRSGDGIRIMHNQLLGTGVGADLDAVAGAYGNEIVGNVITACEPIIIRHLLYPVIARNQIEVPNAICAAHPATNAAAIDIRGDVAAPVRNPTVIDNQISLEPAADNRGVRFDFTTGGEIRANRFVAHTGVYKLAKLTANAVSALMGPNDIIASGLPEEFFLVEDLSTSTIYQTHARYINVAGGVSTGAVNTAGLAQMGVITVTPTCAADCTHTWTYTVAAVDALGNVALPSAAVSALNGPTLDAANYNTITFSDVANATKYNVYRTASGGVPATLGLWNVMYQTNGIGAPLITADTGYAAAPTALSPTVNRTGTFNGMLAYDIAGSRLKVLTKDAGGAALHVDRAADGTGDKFWGVSIDNPTATDSMSIATASTAYTILPWVQPGGNFIYFPTYLNIGTGGGSIPSIGLNGTGVGIGAFPLPNQGGVAIKHILEANIAALPAGSVAFCTDCAITTCAAAGGGAWVFKGAGAPVCPF